MNICTFIISIFTEDIQYWISFTFIWINIQFYHNHLIQESVYYGMCIGILPTMNRNHSSNILFKWCVYSRINWIRIWKFSKDRNTTCWYYQLRYCRYGSSSAHKIWKENSVNLWRNRHGCLHVFTWNLCNYEWANTHKGHDDVLRFIFLNYQLDQYCGCMRQK